jgi:hypothetical protein
MKVFIKGVIYLLKHRGIGISSICYATEYLSLPLNIRIYRRDSWAPENSTNIFWGFVGLEVNFVWSITLHCGVYSSVVDC